MRIDEQLRLVLPVDRSDGSTVYIHAAPIGREVFQKYWLPLSKAFAAIYSEGLGIVAGPRIAALMLRRVSEDAGLWEGPGGVRAGLMEEIKRLANVVAPESGQGWTVFPYSEAVARGLVDEEDADEIDGVLVFFTLAWRLHRGQDRQAILDGAVRLWGASMLSQTLSAFADSLRTSTATANTGATATEASSQQSSTGLAVLASKRASLTGSMNSPGEAPPSFASAI